MEGRAQVVFPTYTLMLSVSLVDHRASLVLLLLRENLFPRTLRDLSSIVLRLAFFVSFHQRSLAVS